MSKQKIVGWLALAGSLSLGFTTHAQASAYAVSYNNILNLAVTSTDENGENGPFFIPIEDFTDFSALSAAAAQLDGTGDPANPSNSDQAGGPVDALPAFGANSIFPVAAPANNDMTPLGQDGNYSQGDAQVITTALSQVAIGSPVVPTGNLTQAWNIAESYVDATGFGNALGRNGSETGFNTTLTLDQPARLHFSFDADPYMEVAKGSAATGGTANANLEVTFTVTSGGNTVFGWSPDGFVSATGNLFCIINNVPAVCGTETLDPFSLNGSVDVTTPGDSAIYDPTADNSAGTVNPAVLGSFSAMTSVLPPGVYTVSLDMLENVNVRTAETATAALGDRVWEDLDADGIQDCADDGDGIIGGPGDVGPECDTGIPDVIVSLLDPGADGDCNSGDESLVDTTSTNLAGFYEFLDLDPTVEYCVRFDQPSANEQLQCADFINPGIGAQFSPANQGGDDALDSDADVTTGQTGNISLNAGDFDRTWDAGLYCPAKIGDMLVDDRNRNGIQDPGEPGIDGQLVELVECVNGVPGNVVIDSRTTANDGMYMFNPLPPGEYAVIFSRPGDTVFSPQDQGGDDGVDCDTDMNGLSQCVNLAPGQYDDTVDACVNQPPAGLGDRVWEDLNADGIQDIGEPGIPDVTVILLDPGADGDCNSGDETQTDTTTTEANGLYQFINLDPGRYCVEFETPDICDPVIGGVSAFSPPNQGADDTADSDADPLTGQTGNIDLDPDEFDPTNDAGVYCPAKIGDRVWNDTNEDGIQDGGEPGISGVTVKLYSCGPDNMSGTVDDVLLDSAVTAVNDGMYMFNPLEPGNYFVQCVQPDGLMFSPQDQGADDAIDSDASTATGVTACTNLQSNEYDPTWDCGLFEPQEPGIDIEKATNGVDADDPNAGDAPQLAIGSTVSWTYVVTNTGNVPLENVVVTDDQGVAVSCPKVSLGVAESMICTASGLADDLLSTGFTTVPGLCGSIPNSPLYENMGTATGEYAPGEFVEDVDPSHYCNPPPQELLGCRFTGGLNDKFPTAEGENRYTAGGQVGANTGQQPQPKGEWTHTQHSGPAGDFTFHGGTSSAPEGTEIDAIRCSDPGGCRPSGNPPSPVKQLDFDGIGTFRNIGKQDAKTPDFVNNGANVTAEGNGNKDFDGTFHWFEVNIDDLGEPGNTNPMKNPGDADTNVCPLIGFGEKGAIELAECSCSDFYRISIYDGVDAADVVKNPDGSIDPNQLNRTDVIYEVWGYIDGGNLQLHHPTGFDSK